MSAYLLRAGDTGPTQQSPVTCGAACLTVARMLVDDPFARWVTAGSGLPVLGAEGSTPVERFASYERTVHRRTNGLKVSRAGIRPPWPRALGTPPWGARAELEAGASRVGTRYEVDVLRPLGEDGLRAAFERLHRVVDEGEPALLYVGSDLLPRHVTLVLPGQLDDVVDVYEPASGHVRQVTVTEVVEARLGLGGWDRAWLLVRPTGERPARAGSRPAFDPRRVPVPRLVPGTAPAPDAVRSEPVR